MNQKLKALALALLLCVHGRTTKDLSLEVNNTPGYVIGSDQSGRRWKGTTTCNHGDPEGDGFVTIGASGWEQL